jgi:general secretion pathway protein F
MRFEVLAVRDGAAIETMVVDAPDAAAARARAIGAGLAVVSVERALGVATQTAARSGTFSLDLFCQELLAMLDAGVTVGEALETLAAKEAPHSRHLIALLLQSIREGKTLSAAMQAQPAAFPRLLVESLRASELTSDYVPALGRYVRYRKLVREIRAKLVAASVYPVLLLGVSGLVLLFLVGYVVPRFAQVYADMGDRLPAASHLLLVVGQAIGAQPAATMVVLIAAVAAAVAAARSVTMRALAHRLVYRIGPLRRMLTTVAFARMYRTLALLLHGGLAVVPALSIVRGLLPPVLQTQLDAVTRSVSEGRPFAATMLDHGLASPVADRFFRVGEQSGRLAEMIDRAAEFHEDEVHRAADWAGRVVGPVLMLLMGAVIGLIVVLMYLPIFQLADSIQ